MIENDDLISIAIDYCRPVKMRLSHTAGEVASALETINGNIYTGVCLDMSCGIGFCAEASAISEMVKNGETKIRKIVAVFKDGSILPPCGRCRELISQVDAFNEQTTILLPGGRVSLLKDILPDNWMNQFE